MGVLHQWPINQGCSVRSIHPSSAHTQQGFHVRRCDIASIKDPAGRLFHDKTFKASLWTELIPCHPQTPISPHIHTYVFEMLWSERSPRRLKWVGDCSSLTGGGLGCLSALSALSCCSLNDKKEPSLDDAASSGLIVSVLSSYHSVSWGYRLPRIKAIKPVPRGRPLIITLPKAKIKWHSWVYG